ncbi:methyltransferase [Streptomyces sp. NPDC059037]|uniref:methyltransferase n=1 Tax=Streptomyces sp. NPDC059037 TaxID=3346710 RepID=UPI0036AFC80C
MPRNEPSTAPRPDATAPPAPTPILKILNGVHKSAVLRAGIQLHVFDALVTGPCTARTVALSIEADERATRILLDALTGIDMLERTGNEYRLTPVSERYLVFGKDTYFGDAARIQTHDYLWEGDRRLADAVRAGGSVLASETKDEHPFWREFAQASGQFAVQGARFTAGLLGPWAASHPELDILDLAAGSGLYGCLLAAEFPAARVTLLDWPDVLGTHRAAAQRLRVADRVTELSGDVLTAPYGGPYDLVLLNNVLHNFGERRCVELLTRAAEALKPGGRVVVQDFVPGGPDTDPEGVARIFSVLMLIITAEGQVYDGDQMQDMLAAAGLSIVSRHEAPHMPTSVLLAERVV